MTRFRMFAGPSLALLLAAAVGCDTLECGDGTHRAGDLCVTNVRVQCGEGTRFEDGRCVSEAADAGPGADLGTGLICGAGTHVETGECVPDRTADAGPTPDALPADAAIDLDDGVFPDVGPDAGVPDANPDPDAAPPPRCPPGLELPGPPPACEAVPGTYCVHGVALDFVSGCALPDDAGLVVLLIDPAAAAGGAPIEEYTRGVGVIDANGGFSIQGAGPSTQLALVIDEGPDADGDVYTRSLSGVTAAQPSVGQTFTVTAFASTQDQQQVWNDALGLPARGLEQTGFLLGRVFEIGAEGLSPLASAQVRGRLNGDLPACVQSCLRFFDDDPGLTGFQPAGAQRTGASGGFLIIRGGPNILQDQFFVDGNPEYADIPAGASPGSGFHTAFVPQR